MAGRQFLDLAIKVRILVPEPLRVVVRFVRSSALVGRFARSSGLVVRSSALVGRFGRGSSLVGRLVAARTRAVVRWFAAWPHRLVVRTSASHAEYSSSNLLGVTIRCESPSRVVVDRAEVSAPADAVLLPASFLTREARVSSTLLVAR